MMQTTITIVSTGLIMSREREEGEGGKGEIEKKNDNASGAFMRAVHSRK